MHQIHAGLFSKECGEFNVTPVQFGLLTVLISGEPLDQVTLSTAVGIDRTSGADVIKRLHRRGLVERIRSDQDKRANLVRITDDGRELVNRMQPKMERAQEQLLSPLTFEEQSQFIEFLQKVIREKNAESRAPMDSDYF